MDTKAMISSAFTAHNLSDSRGNKMPNEVRFQAMIAVLQPAIDASENLKVYLDFVIRRRAKYDSAGYLCDHALDIVRLLECGVQDRGFIVAMDPRCMGSECYYVGRDNTTYAMRAGYSEVILVHNGKISYIKFSQISHFLSTL